MGRAAKPKRIPDSIVGSEGEFRLLVENERRRSERSRRPFVILQIHTSAEWKESHPTKLQAALLDSVAPALRETDRIAWLEGGTALCVICTETGASDEETAGLAITQRLRQVLADVVPPGMLQLSFISSVLLRPAPDAAEAEMDVNAPSLGSTWKEAFVA